MLDLMVLRPSRRAKQEARAPQTTAARPARSKAADEPEQKQPIKLPDPLQHVRLPELMPEIDTRFKPSNLYPHETKRNIFIPYDYSISGPRDAILLPESHYQPQVSYHGFFTVDHDRVALLRSSDELLMTRAGNLLSRTPYKLVSIHPEKIVIADTRASNRQFEITLSERNID